VWKRTMVCCACAPYISRRSPCGVSRSSGLGAPVPAVRRTGTRLLGVSIYGSRRLSLSRASVLILSAVIGASGCRRNAIGNEPNVLVGAWHSSVTFDDGPFASLKDLEFLYVFNSGGARTESSHYDGVPPVAPAYGSWTRIGPRGFEATYEFFVTKPPARIDDLSTGGGWLPDGRGRFDERIRVSADGSSF